MNLAHWTSINHRGFKEEPLPSDRLVSTHDADFTALSDALR